MVLKKKKEGLCNLEITTSKKKCLSDVIAQSYFGKCFCILARIVPGFWYIVPGFCQKIVSEDSQSCSKNIPLPLIRVLGVV